jgi:hypothetical protein
MSTWSGNKEIWVFSLEIARYEQLVWRQIAGLEAEILPAILEREIWTASLETERHNQLVSRQRDMSSSSWDREIEKLQYSGDREKLSSSSGDREIWAAGLDTERSDQLVYIKTSWFEDREITAARLEKEWCEQLVWRQSNMNSCFVDRELWAAGLETRGMNSRPRSRAIWVAS